MPSVWPLHSRVYGSARTHRGLRAGYQIYECNHSPPGGALVQTILEVLCRRASVLFHSANLPSQRLLASTALSFRCQILRVPCSNNFGFSRLRPCLSRYQTKRVPCCSKPFGSSRLRPWLYQVPDPTSARLSGELASTALVYPGARSTSSLATEHLASTAMFTPH